MGYPVTYYCPHCEALVELERDGYLADKAVTPYPFTGWNYVAPDEDVEADGVDGVRFVCGTHGLLKDEDEAGCGETFYLSFVRFEDGEEQEPRPETSRVQINPDPCRSSPRGPSGPGGPDGGFSG